MSCSRIWHPHSQCNFLHLVIAAAWCVSVAEYASMHMHSLWSLSLCHSKYVPSLQKEIESMLFIVNSSLTGPWRPKTKRMPFCLSKRGTMHLRWRVWFVLMFCVPISYILHRDSPRSFPKMTSSVVSQFKSTWTLLPSREVAWLHCNNIWNFNQYRLRNWTRFRQID